ncbi:hypothetical protein [Burkholderia lata]|uniref:hypothetical protein n=1 Tax=Burkholderia lata (strain ATCC 17760 / DSM 23089 / LMG 22485 / NCIMB 9086 / R18194 / 383) TaxID=482957 RepID=UPI00158294F4|nr:hypothetical protein [Burkholderia lata]
MKPLLFEKCDECGIGAGLRARRRSGKPGVVVPLAFVSAGADHAAILCANTGCRRERRRVARDQQDRIDRGARSVPGADDRKRNTPPR